MEMCDGLGQSRSKVKPKYPPRLSLAHIVGRVQQNRNLPATGVNTMMKLLRQIKTDKSGASAAEYALMIALIGGVIVVAAGLLGQNMKTVFESFGTKMLTSSTAT